jgi:hypothetical protein
MPDLNLIFFSVFLVLALVVASSDMR